jgi:hypothetical protein
MLYGMNMRPDSRGFKVVAFVLCLAQASCAASWTCDPNTVLVIDKYCVGQDEFNWFMQQERGGVLSQFVKDCGIEQGPRFWDSDCNGVTPRAAILKRTVDRLVSDKTEQKLFCELGLLASASYQDFIANLAAINRQREQAVMAHRVVYGPVRYTQQQYYGHWMANLRLRAKEKLGESRFDCNEPKLKAFYASSQRYMVRERFIFALEAVTVTG